MFLGVDGGGTQCRARLINPFGTVLGEGVAGPANIRLGLAASLGAVLDAARQCLERAGLDMAAFGNTIACLALAGASEPAEAAAAREHGLPFAATVVTTDAHAACIGAHDGADGGIVIAGTGSIGWAVVAGKTYRVGGWGLPLSDEGSGAWLGIAALRRVLRAYDGRIAWTGLLRRLFADFGEDPHAIVRWAAAAAPGDFGALAPHVVDAAAHEDPEAVVLMRRAAASLDAIAMRLIDLGAERLALAGGLAAAIEPWLDEEIRGLLVPPAGDALDGALRLARAVAAEMPR